MSKGLYASLNHMYHMCQSVKALKRLVFHITTLVGEKHIKPASAKLMIAHINLKIAKLGG